MRRLRDQISSIRIALIAGTAALVVVLIFIIQNANAVGITFLGAHLHLPLAVALLFAAIAGALIMAAAGTARITELRQIMRRDRRKSRAGNQPGQPAASTTGPLMARSPAATAAPPPSAVASTPQASDPRHPRN